MIRRLVWVQVTAFAVITLTVTAYLVFGILNVPLVERPITVALLSERSGGLFPRAVVAYRGVEIGEVEAVELVPGEGVRTTLSLDPDADVPSDLVADVSAFSAIGEQYVNLKPQRQGPPYLADGDVIRSANVELPPVPAEVLADVDRFLATLDTDALTTVVAELGDAFTELGPVLQQVLDDGQSVTNTLQQALPDTVRIARSGETVLDGQLAVQGSIRTFAENLALVSEQLVASDPDIRVAIDEATLLSQELLALLDDPTRRALAVLLGNAITVNEVLVAHRPAIEQLARVAPDSLAALTRLVGDGNALPVDIFFQDVERCDYGTSEVPPEQTNRDDPPSAQLDGYCPSVPGRYERGAQRVTNTAPDDREVEYGVQTFRDAAATASAEHARALGRASWTVVLLNGLAR